MPKFFNPNDLTELQRSRWDLACSEYAHVQDKNARRELAKLSTDQRVDMLSHYPNLTDLSDDAYLCTLFLRLRAQSPGDCKSALFARLLNGGKALDFPPPTYFSYPWYDVVEKEGPFDVLVGEFVEPGTEFWMPTDLDAIGGVFIGQSLWRIDGANDAGTRLISLDRELKAHIKKTAKLNTEGAANSSTPLWTEDFLGRVMDTYEASPSFSISHDDRHFFQLQIGVASSTAPRHFAEDMRDIRQSVFELEHTLSVLNLLSLRIDVRIGRTISPGEDPDVLLARAKDGLESASTAGIPTLFAQLALDSAVKVHAERVRRKAIRSDLNDLVEVKSAGWCITKN